MTSTTLPLSDGGRLGLRTAGSGNPVVLIHGVGLQSSVWQPQIEALSEHYQVFALDMPGHGDSSPLQPGSQLVEFVDWLFRALQALELKQVSLIGHSMGALIAAGFTITHPEMVSRVALLNGVYCRDAAAREAVESRARALVKGCVDHDTPLERWFGDNDHAARALVAPMLRSVNLSGYATAYTAFSLGDRTYADRFREIQCPLLAMTGGDDPNSTPSMSRAMANAAPDGHVVVVEGHRHMAPLTAADQVNAALLQWMDMPAEPKEIA